MFMTDESMNELSNAPNERMNQMNESSDCMSRKRKSPLIVQTMY